MKNDNPKTVVFPMVEEDISFYSVWIYPHSVVKNGARVVFFRANREDKIVCYIYLPEDFATTSDKDYRAATDWVCAVAEDALQEQLGIAFSYHNYDTHIDAGELNLADLEA